MQFIDNQCVTKTASSVPKEVKDFSILRFCNSLNNNVLWLRGERFFLALNYK